MTELEIIAIAIAVPVFFLTMAVEFFVLRRKAFRNLIGYAWRDTLASLSMGSGYLVLSALAKLLWLPAFIWLHQFRALDIPSRWWSWALLFVLQDFCFYWAHRSHHHVRFLWAAHVNHHSSQHYNLSTALRQSWTEHITALPFYVPLVLLGFDLCPLAHAVPGLWDVRGSRSGSEADERRIGVVRARGRDRARTGSHIAPCVQPQHPMGIIDERVGALAGPRRRSPE